MDSMEKRELLVLKDILGTNKRDRRRDPGEAPGERYPGRQPDELAGVREDDPARERWPAGSRIGFRMAVIEGDIETERDAERIRARGIPAWQITTGGACHLEAKMIGKVLSEVPADLDFLFIENVGNLVCPASYDLGESPALRPPVLARRRRQAQEIPRGVPVLPGSGPDQVGPHPPPPLRRRSGPETKPWRSTRASAVFMVSALTGRGDGRAREPSSSPRARSSGPPMHELSVVAGLFEILEEKAREPAPPRRRRSPSGSAGCRASSPICSNRPSTPSRRERSPPAPRSRSKRPAPRPVPFLREEPRRRSRSLPAPPAAPRTSRSSKGSDIFLQKLEIETNARAKGANSTPA